MAYAFNDWDFANDRPTSVTRNIQQEESKTMTPDEARAAVKVVEDRRGRETLDRVKSLVDAIHACINRAAHCGNYSTGPLDIPANPQYDDITFISDHFNKLGFNCVIDNARHTLTLDWRKSIGN